MRDASKKEMNRVIAEFMGAKREGNHMHIPHRGFSLSLKYYPAQLQYSCNWTWLMPVIEKIGEEKHTEGEESYHIYPVTFGMRDEEGNFMVRLYCFGLHSAKTLIEAAHSAVYEYIIWHNSQANKTT